MNMKIETANDKMYIYLSGEIDHHSIKEIREKIDSQIFEIAPKEVYLDLAQIDFMDSSGLGLVLGRLRTVKGVSGKLYVQNPNNRINTILQLAGVDKLIKTVYTQNNERTEQNER